jgi:hypothetical protein|tara:strand:- start:198 stop:602 length:405 start_codon:yes stop_codon:yes gene_type:complete
MQSNNKQIGTLAGHHNQPAGPVTERNQMSAVKKKSETCEEQLRRMCKRIADDISDNDGTTASEWMEGVYDIRYIVDREKRYFSAELMVAGGGPTVWVNLNTMEVEGYWWGDKVQEPFIDNLGLDDYCEDMYASS